VKNLNLEDNSLGEIPIIALSGMINLEKIYLGATPHEKIPENVFRISVCPLKEIFCLLVMTA
jgi:hypothetical protein